VSVRPQVVKVPGIGQVRFAAAESIRTEISCKYDIPSIAALFSAAGLRLESWKTDPERRFVLVVAKPV
jgi:L-histidine N-alpha-methyltransferase